MIENSKGSMESMRSKHLKRINSKQLSKQQIHIQATENSRNHTSSSKIDVHSFGKHQATNSLSLKKQMSGQDTLFNSKELLNKPSELTIAFSPIKLMPVTQKNQSIKAIANVYRKQIFIGSI